ncbi:GNAT family N-acetyltransferase [Nitratifractor sp.]
MKRNVSLAIPNDKSFIPLALHLIKETAHLAGLDPPAAREILHASRELLGNAVRHAYPKGQNGLVDIDIQLQPQGIQISVHDMGLPFNFDQYMLSERRGGLKRIRRYVDELRFANLGKGGKSFTIFKSHPLQFDGEDFRPYSDLEDSSPSSLKPASIQIRDFRAGDGEAVSRLIYSNYSYSYFKEIFYYPRKVRELNEKGEIASVVAETREGKIVGHFALILVPESKIAEVGVVVVHPDYKGQGIMNAMLDRLMVRAHQLGLSAVFGEALMLHPYSQRSNLRHGFGEAALVLGLVLASTSLNDTNVVQSRKRGAVLVGFKILAEEKERKIHLCDRYRRLVEKIYDNLGMRIEALPREEGGSAEVEYEMIPYKQIGTILIEGSGEGLRPKLRAMLHLLYRKHVDMIYADINLVRCGDPERVIDLLREEGFVFSGVLPFRKREEDYLRMQLPNSEEIETEKLVCYSEFCRELHGEILHELEEVGEPAL